MLRRSSFSDHGAAMGSANPLLATRARDEAQHIRSFLLASPCGALLAERPRAVSCQPISCASGTLGGSRAEPCEMRTLTRAGPRWFIASSGAPPVLRVFDHEALAARGRHYFVIAGAAASHLAYGSGVLGDD